MGNVGVEVAQEIAALLVPVDYLRDSLIQVCFKIRGKDVRHRAIARLVPPQRKRRGLERGKVVDLVLIE